MGGHLVTIDNAEENTWVYNTFSTYGGVQRAIWLGLTDQGHEGTFTWSSGSPSSYRNWSPGEPNNVGGVEHFVHLWWPADGKGPTWNDTGGDLGVPIPLQGLVELDSCSPHKAAATAQVVNGFVVGVNLTDSGCGYTNPPVILIQGGGGTNAIATAIMESGRVAAITIVNPGCCYTNLPRIVIGSPPFVPSLSIRTSRIKVLQNVTLGRSYLLESSSNLVNWAAAGPQFTAQSETIDTEFEVDVTGRYFRIREVP